MVRRAAAGQSKSKQSHLNNRKCVGVFLLVFCLVFLHEAIQNYISKSKSRVHVFITHPIDPAPKEKTRAPSIHAHTLSMAICELLQTSLGLDTHKILLHFSFPRMIVPWNQQLLHRWAPEKKGRLRRKHQLADSYRFVGLIIMIHTKANSSSEPPVALWESATTQKQNIS